MLSSKVNLFSCFSILYYFKHGNLSILLAPLQGEIDMRAHWVFCRKLSFQQLLLHIIGIFSSVEPKSQSFFPFSSSMFEFIHHTFLSISYNTYRWWRYQRRKKSQLLNQLKSPIPSTGLSFEASLDIFSRRHQIFPKLLRDHLQFFSKIIFEVSVQFFISSSKNFLKISQVSIKIFF